MAEFTAKVVRPESVTITLPGDEAEILLSILKFYIEEGGGWDVTAPQWANQLKSLGFEADAL